MVTTSRAKPTHTTRQSRTRPMIRLQLPCLTEGRLRKYATVLFPPSHPDDDFFFAPPRLPALTARPLPIAASVATTESDVDSSATAHQNEREGFGRDVSNLVDEKEAHQLLQAAVRSAPIAHQGSILFVRFAKDDLVDLRNAEREAISARNTIAAALRDMTAAAARAKEEGRQVTKQEFEQMGRKKKHLAEWEAMISTFDGKKREIRLNIAAIRGRAHKANAVVAALQAAQVNGEPLLQEENVEDPVEEPVHEEGHLEVPALQEAQERVEVAVEPALREALGEVAGMANLAEATGDK
ncbi:hypothetical protein ACP70R_036149 [Stipagrostis hirtigluma subsp. patula]